MGDQSGPPQGGASHPNDGSGDPERNSQQSSDADSSTVRVSRTFHPHANLDQSPPNTLILSVDKILFVVHYRWLYAQSVNLFNGLLLHTVEPAPENPLTRSVSERAEVINLLFHAVYNLSCEFLTPTLECLGEVLVALDKYGFLPIQRFMSQGSPLCNAYLAHASADPMEVFAIAASNELEDLAVASSPYTLHLSINHMSTVLVDRIGLHYLHRLYSLHGMRINALRRLFDEEPALPPHGGHAHDIIRAYQLSGTQAFYSASPSTSRAHIEAAMTGLVNSITCAECKAGMIHHVSSVCERWSQLPTTI